MIGCITKDTINQKVGLILQQGDWYRYRIYSNIDAHRFGFIGSPLACLNACTAQGADNVVATPNFNAEADGMASIISHEIMEVVTDPLINAW